MRVNNRSQVLLVALLALTQLVVAAQLAVLPGADAAVVAAAAPSKNAGLDSDGDGTFDRHDAVSAAMAARAKKARVEDLSQRTPSTQVFANPDGTWTTEASAGPVWAQDPETGLWGPIDTTLTQRAGRWSSRAGVGAISFSDGGDGALVAMKDVDGTDLSWTWPTRLPAPAVSGSTLTYRNAVPHGDLVVTAVPGGFSHSIVLRARPGGPLDLPMLVKTDGARLRLADDGSVSIGTGGERLVSAPTPMMWDTGLGPVGVATHVPVDATVERAAGETQLVLKPDAEFLADPDTVYPVTIDPTFTITTAASSWIQSPASPNGAVNDQWMKVGTSDSGANKARSFLRFDTSSLVGKDVTDAQLSLYTATSGICADASIKAQRVTQDWAAATLTWADQPSATPTGEATSTLPAKGGPTGCSTQGRDTWNLTDIAAAWAGGSDNDGVRLIATDETANSSWRTFYSPHYTGAADVLPKLTVTWNQTPEAAATPTNTDSRMWNNRLHIRTTTPQFTTSAADPDLGTVRYTVEVHETDDPASPAVATCRSKYVASGTQASCTSPQLAQGEYYVRAAADDQRLTGAWSPWLAITINSAKPELPTISCPGTANARWYTTRPAATMTCTFTSAGAAQVEWALNDGTSSLLTTNGAGAASTAAIAIPVSGWTRVKVRGISSSERATDWTQYAFGTGDPVITAPAESAGSASTFSLSAAAAPGATSAKLQYLNASLVWVDATAVKTSAGAPWTGTVVTNSDITTVSGVVWTPAAEALISAPAVLQTRMVFTYPSGTTTRLSQVRTLQLNAHDFTTAGPSAAVGPGIVSLSSGEFQTSNSDVAIGGLAILRSHLSNAPISTTNTAFGPGWLGSLAPGGPASYTVIDQRGTSGSFLFQTPEGITYAYQHADAAASNLTGTFVAQGDAVTLDAAVKLDPETGVLSYTESGGTVTTFERQDGTWLPATTSGTGAQSTTSYRYSGGLISWIVAPAPAGLTCSPASLPVGCSALHVNYTTTSSGAKRAASIDYQAWDPKLADGDGDAGNDGLPDAGAAITTTTVAKYAYNTDGTLQAVWDPRAGDGASALKTAYEYESSGTGTAARIRVTKIAPPGLKAWQINYDSDGAVSTITRAQDAAVGTGNATWTIKYGIPLNASGLPQGTLPNMSPAVTATWSQSADDAPDTGAAVFGPNKVPAGTPAAGDWAYASLYYWNAAGRLTNTATWGWSNWRIQSTKYDDVGNQIWSLTPGAFIAAQNSGTNLALAADRYAAQTLYNATGSRIEAEYGPMRGTDQSLSLRPLTQYVYDDEADPALTTGRPATIPAGGFDLPVEVRTSGSNEIAPGAWSVGQNDPPSGSSVHLYDRNRTRYGYDEVATGDPSGWTLRQPTRVLAQNGGAWDATLYRYDATGRVVQERTPQSSGTGGDQARWHDTVYYTADGSAARDECDNKPEWAGLTCWEGPHVQPATGQAIPVITHTGYAVDGSPTRTVTTGGILSAGVVTSGVTTKVQVNGYDAAGRPVRAATTTTGTGDQTIPATTTGYSATTGLPTTVTNGTMTLTTAYDSWGRTLSQSDGAGSTTVRTYNAAGQVNTVNDGKGTYGYTYDSSSEHRGMPTSITTGVSGMTIDTAYDGDGNLMQQSVRNAAFSGTYQAWRRDVAGNIYYVQSVTSDDNGNIESSAQYSVGGQMKSLTEPGGYAFYTYDDRGRLTETARLASIKPADNAECHITAYTLSGDSNRTALTRFDPDGDGYCQRTAPLSTKSSTYDSADRITSTGYVYDNLGRTTTLPAADTSTPAGGNVTTGYYANDMVASLAQGTKSQTYTLDPLGRISTTKNLTGGVSLVESTNHYADGSDSPAWTETKTRPNASTGWTTTWTRYVKGVDGAIAVIQSPTGTPKVLAYNPHGDVISTIPFDGCCWDNATSYDEFGAPRTASTARYGWLGQAQRDSQNIGGLTLMGARLYNPLTGRFLSRDAIYGGNDNAYIYPADPINDFDTSGAFTIKNRWFSWNVGLHWHHWWGPDFPDGITETVTLTMKSMKYLAAGSTITTILDAFRGAWNNNFSFKEISKALAKTLLKASMGALGKWVEVVGGAAVFMVAIGRCARLRADITLQSVGSVLSGNVMSAVRYDAIDC